MNIIQIEKLSEKKSVSELFKELFPEEECPFYGGYGYAENDLVSIDATSEFQGISLETQFIRARCYAELNLQSNNGQTYEVIHVDKKNQQLVKLDEKIVDVIEYTIIAIPSDILSELKKDFNTYNPYLNKEEIKNKFFEKLDAASVMYDTKAYFNISKFFGKLF